MIPFILYVYMFSILFIVKYKLILTTAVQSSFLVNFNLLYLLLMHACTFTIQRMIIMDISGAFVFWFYPFFYSAFNWIGHEARVDGEKN